MMKFISVFLLIVLGFIFVSRKNSKPIIIGFAAQLTGKQAELGVQERNGALLAVEKINASGGIFGRKIELIIRDDLGIPEKAQSVDSELIKKGAVAIIGHATSTQALSGLKVTNAEKVVMVAPIVSTPELSGVDDYFFRVYPSFVDISRDFARYICKDSGISRMAIIYDVDNSAYSKTYSTIFADSFQALGGNIVGKVNFSSVDKPDFSGLLSKLRESKAEGLLIIASDIDTALIAQRARLMGWQIPLFSSSWAATQNLINDGGQAVEGLKFEQAFKLTNQTSTYSEFKASYQTRFGNEPSFGANLAYDATMVLAEALKKTEGESKGLKQALLEIRDFPGIMGNFSFDSFGDVKRPSYLSTIHKGKFINIDKFNSKHVGGD